MKIFSIVKYPPVDYLNASTMNGFLRGVLYSLLMMLMATGDDMPDGLRALAMAYPDAFKLDKNHTLIWPDGTKMKYHGVKRELEPSHDEMLDTASLEEQMTQRYPIGPESFAPPPENFEPGRIRHETFFKKMYGSSAMEVGEKLRTIIWLPNLAPQKLRVSTINGIDKKLEAVSADLEKLPKDFRRYITPSAGTYNWRMIAGTKRLSNHSFGTAIDLNVDESTYWKWDKRMTYRNKIPREIVEIFEKHEFIWGGKWFHYDTMHFEYRPELLLLARKGTLDGARKKD